MSEENVPILTIWKLIKIQINFQFGPIVLCVSIHQWLLIMKTDDWQNKYDKSYTQSEWFLKKKNKKQTNFENETHKTKVRQIALTVSHVAVCAKSFLVGQMNRRIWTYLDVLQTDLSTLSRLDFHYLVQLTDI